MPGASATRTDTKHPAAARLGRAACALLAAGLFATAPFADDALYKWVDEDGNVTYQDRPPPDAAGNTQVLGGEAGERAAGLPEVEVVLYTTADCAACEPARALLRSRSIPFAARRPGDDPALEARIRKEDGELALPALLIGDTLILGHDRERILAALDAAGFPGALLDIPAMETGAGARQDRRKLTREDLETMTPEAIEQAARDAALRGVDNDLFEEDEGFLTLNKDIFSAPGAGSGRRDARDGRGDAAGER